MRNYTISFLFIVLLACKKDNKMEEEFPASYVPHQWKSGPIRLFTRLGEIKDANKVDRFLLMHGQEIEFYTGTQPGNPNSFVMHLVRPDSAFFIDVVPPYGYYPCTLSGSGNDRMLTSKDTITTWLSAGSYEFELYRMQVRNGFAKYLPAYEELLVAGDPAIAFPQYSIRPIFYARRAGTYIEIPYLYHTLFRTNRLYRTEHVSNVLNEKGYGVLHSGDTMVVQERVLTTLKKS